MGGIVLPPGQAPVPAGVAGVYLLPADALWAQGPPWLIEGRPVRAWALHPERADLVYVTIGHPESLTFLPEPYVETD